MKNDKPTAAERIADAEAVRDELRAELARVGVKLPSLGIETLAYVDHMPVPLVDLGRCNLLVARALISALRQAPAAA